MKINFKVMSIEKDTGILAMSDTMEICFFAPGSINLEIGDIIEAKYRDGVLWFPVPVRIKQINYTYENGVKI